MTQAGIEHDLKKSPYVTTVRYGDGNTFMFYFSSQKGKDKFDRERSKHMEQLRDSLSARFKMKVRVASSFSDVDLYRRVEGRGFYIHRNGYAIQYPAEFAYSVKSE